MAFPEQAVVIAVIGVIGSGKSAFINVASRSSSPVINSPGSCTSELRSVSFSLDGRSVILIDTPEFDGTTLSVLEVLKLISDHFSGLQGAKLAGVIYMHCITDAHTRDSSRHNFHVFSKFCGDASLRDVLVVTNEQGSADKDEFFGLAIESGARMICHDGSQGSAQAILRHLLNREHIVPLARDSFSQQTDSGQATTEVYAAYELTGQVEHHTKALGELCQQIDAVTVAKDEKAKRILQEEAESSLEKIEHIRYDLEKMVTNVATRNSRLEDENRRYKVDFTAQKAEADLRIRLLGDERKARELAEARREQAEAQLAEERALWERQKMERESSNEHVGPKYDKLFACGALIFVFICVSRFAFDASVILQT